MEEKDAKRGQMRAAHLQENVRAIGKLGVDSLVRVRARVPDVVAEIDAALRTTWLDARLDVELTEAVHQELGPDAARHVNRAAMTASLNGPLLKPMRDGLVRVLGLTPATAFKWMPRGWEYIYKDFGEVVWDADRGEVRIVSLPRFALEAVGWCEGCAGAALGIIDLAGGHDARVDMERRVDDGVLVLKVRWTS